MAKPECFTCRFRGGVGQYYDCRRHAPITFELRGGVKDARWPQVTWSDWCGDYEPIPVAPSEEQNTEMKESGK
jgi:hypothetical protein